MPKCIYCLNSDPQVTFQKSEHVIPRMMGTFQNNPLFQNPTLRGLVCDTCNGDVFSPLECRFKEDTEEGLFMQMFKLGGSCQVRMRNNRTRAVFESGLDNEFFDRMFPFFENFDGVWKIALVPQIQVRLPNGTLLVLLTERLAELSPGKTRKLREQLHGVSASSVSIIAPGDSAEDRSNIDSAIDLVRSLGIDYREGESVFEPFPERVEERQFGIEVNCTFGSDGGRMLAKIAFNYLAFCCTQIGMTEVLYDASFNRIRQYVVGEAELPVREVVTSMQREPVVWDEATAGVRFIGHQVSFRGHAGRVVAEVSFMGKNVYTIDLGSIPDVLNREGFGCGHLFSPLDNRALQLTRNSASWGSGNEPGFGPFFGYH